MLEFTSRTTRTRLIATGISPCGWVVFIEAFDCVSGWCWSCVWRASNLLGVGGLLHRCALVRNFLHHRFLFVFGHGPDLRQLLRHVLPETIEHCFEQLERFVFVFVQRVALRIATEPDDTAQMF